MGGLSAASQARISVPQDIFPLCAFDDDPLFQDHERGYDLRLTGSDKHGGNMLWNYF